MFDILFYFGGFCVLFGVLYPLGAMIIYPFYRMFGGEQSFVDYMRSL